MSPRWSANLLSNDDNVEVIVKIDLAKLTDAHKIDIQDALEAGAFMIETSAKHLCPVDHGALRASIKHEVEDWHTVLVGAYGSKDVSYAAAIEYGTVPHGAPFEPIKRWAERHGIENWWGVWWKIYHHGTPPRPFLAPAVQMHKAKIIKMLAQASADATSGAKQS